MQDTGPPRPKLPIPAIEDKWFGEWLNGCDCFLRVNVRF